MSAARRRSTSVAAALVLLALPLAAALAQTAGQGPVGDPDQGPVGDPDQKGPVGDPDQQGPVGDPDQKGPVGDPDQKGPVGDPDQKGPVGDPDQKGPAAAAPGQNGPLDAPIPDGPAPAIGIDSRALVGDPAGPPRLGPELDEISERMARRMRCPVCQGLSIADSPSMMAIDMRAKVRQMLAEGYSPDQVMTYFEARYGEFVRLAPKARGFNLLVWIAPVAALLIGSLLVAAYLRRQPAPGIEESDAELTPYEERVRREVQS